MVGRTFVCSAACVFRGWPWWSVRCVVVNYLIHVKCLIYSVRYAFWGWPILAKIYCDMGRFYNNRGMSSLLGQLLRKHSRSNEYRQQQWIHRYNSLLGNRPVNISPEHIIALNNKTLLLGNRAVNKLHQQDRLCFSLGPCEVYITTACSCIKNIIHSCLLLIQSYP
jgi:hypothetical protein